MGNKQSLVGHGGKITGSSGTDKPSESGNLTVEAEAEQKGGSGTGKQQTGTSHDSKQGCHLIYGDAGSRYVKIALIAAAELSIHVDLVPVDMARKINQTSAYKVLNPFGKTPTYMSPSGFRLFESRAIARYLCETAKDRNIAEQLYPSRPPESRALVEQWISVETTTMAVAWNDVLYEAVLKKSIHGQEPDSRKLHDLIKMLIPILDVYDDRLSQNDYLAGDFFTLADLFHIPYMHRLIEHPLWEELIVSRPNVFQWWKRCSERSAYIKINRLDPHSSPIDAMLNDELQRRYR